MIYYDYSSTATTQHHPYRERTSSSSSTSSSTTATASTSTSTRARSSSSIASSSTYRRPRHFGIGPCEREPPVRVARSLSPTDFAFSFMVPFNGSSPAYGPGPSAGPFGSGSGTPAQGLGLEGTEADDVERRSPLRRMADKHNVISRMFSRNRLQRPAHNKLPSFDESFDMVTEFEPLPKRARPDPFPLPSPHARPGSPRKPAHAPPPASHQLRPPTSSPRAYKQLALGKQSCPPRVTSVVASDVPLPPSPTSATGAATASAPAGIKMERLLTPPSPAPLALAPTQSRVSEESSRAQRRDVELYADFDKLFAEFPHATGSIIGAGAASAYSDPTYAALLRANTQKSLPTPAPSSSSASASATSSAYGSRAYTPDPSARLESVVGALQQVILTLQATGADHATYILRQADLETRLQSMDRELGQMREERLRLEVDARREREERRRVETEAKRLEGVWMDKVRAAEQATSTAQSSLHHVQLSHNAASSKIATLEQQLRDAHSRDAALQSHIGELEGEVTRLTGAFELVKTDYVRREDALKKRLDEAEFMHKALKESGARLGRELEGQKRKANELEMRHKGFV